MARSLGVLWGAGAWGGVSFLPWLVVTSSPVSASVLASLGRIWSAPSLLGGLARDLVAVGSHEYELDRLGLPRHSDTVFTPRSHVSNTQTDTPLIQTP